MVVSRKLSNIQVLTLLESSPNRIFLFFKKEALYLYREHFECKLSSIKLVSSQLDSNNSKELNVLIQKEIQTLVQIHEGQKNIPYELGCCITVPHSGTPICSSLWLWKSLWHVPMQVRHMKVCIYFYYI